MPACEPTFHPRAEAARRTRAPTADACRKVNVVVRCPHCKNVIRLREVDGQSRVIKYLCSNCQEIVRIDLVQDEVKSSSSADSFEKTEHRKKILVADDTITVRKVTAHLLDRKSTRLNSSH